MRANAAKRRKFAAEGLVLDQNVRDTLRMMKMTKAATVLFAALILMSSVALLKSAPHPPTGAEYTADGQMKLPENYRQWTYLTTGFDMSYNPKAMDMGHHMFDNVFAMPEAY